MKVVVKCWLFITALIRILSKKNATAIDHLLRLFVLSVEGSRFNAMAIQYGRLSTQRHCSNYNPCFLQKFDSIDHSKNYSLSPAFLAI